MAFHWILERVKFTHEIEISGDEVFTIGRGRENVIKCLSLNVSRKHCKILQRGENLTIVDLSSSNGTYINRCRIVPEQESQLKEGDLIGIGVCETEDSDCFVYQLCRKLRKQLVPQTSTLPDSSTAGNEVVIITDSDSENADKDSREAEPKNRKKQPVKEDCIISPKDCIISPKDCIISPKDCIISSKVPRLGDARASLERSSNMSVINCDVHGGGEKRQWKRRFEELDDVTEFKKRASEQKSRRIEKRSAPRTADNNIVFDIVSDSEEIEEKNVSTVNRSAIALDRTHDAGLASDSVTCPAASVSDNVPVSRIDGNQLKKVKPAGLLSEVSDSCRTASAFCDKLHSDSATFSNRKSNNEEGSAVTNNERTQNAEQGVLRHSRTSSVTMDVTVVSVPAEGREYDSDSDSDKMVIDLQDGDRNTVCEDSRTELLNSTFPCVTKKAVVSSDNSLDRTCTVHTELHEHCVQPALHKELPVGDIKRARKPSSEGPSSTISTSLCLGKTNVTKCLGTDKTRHTGSAGKCTSSIVELCATNEGVSITGSTHNKAVSQLNVKVGKDAASCSLYGNNNSSSLHSNIATSNRSELSTAQKSSSIQSKALGTGTKSNENSNIFPASCSVDVNHSSKCRRVPKSESDVPVGSQDVRSYLYSSVTFQEENAECKNKPLKKKIKQTDQSVDGTYKSRLSLVSREPRTLSCKGNKSFVITGGDGVGRHEESRSSSGSLGLTVNNISSHVDSDDIQLPLQHPGCSYSDKNKSKLKMLPVKCRDKRVESSPVLKHIPLEAENLPIEIRNTHDKEPLADKKRQKKPKTRRVIYSSSSSDEDIEKDWCQQQLEPHEQTVGNGKSCVPVLEGKRALLCASYSNARSDFTQSERTNTGSVDEVSTSSHESHMSIQNSVSAVKEYKGKRITQVNRNADGSGSVEGKTRSEEPFVQICQNKVAVKVEIPDESICKSVDSVVSKTEDGDYTLDEDIIVVSDDTDEEFPSSQIFGDQEPSAEFLKADGKDAAHEESVFHKEVEDVDELVLVDDDSDFDDNWLKKLSQHDPEPEPEPVSELPPQPLPVKTGGGDSGSKEWSMKDVSLLEVGADGERTERVPSAGGLLTRGHEVKEKYREPVNKQALMIAAPPLPPRRACQRGISAEAATRMYQQKMDMLQQFAKRRNSVSSAASKKETDSKNKKVKPHLHTVDEPPNLTAQQKKQIADKRKEKLKAISEKDKMVAEASRTNSQKVRAEVRVKVTNKNRGAFLVEGAECAGGGAEVSKVLETSVLSSAVQKLNLDLENLPKQGGSKNSAPQPKKREIRSSSAPVTSIKALPRIPRKSERPSSSSIVTESEVPSSAKVETTPSYRFPVPTSTFPVPTSTFPVPTSTFPVPTSTFPVPTSTFPVPTSTFPVPTSTFPLPTSTFSVPTSTFQPVPILKTSAPAGSTKEGKKVRFKNGSEMVQVHDIPVAENSRLLPVARKKDAPTPRKIVSQQLQQKGPDLEDVLHHILCWNPKWLTEQKNRALSHPPPVYGNSLWPMVTSFVSYNDYLMILTPLLFLELWASISKEYETDAFVPRKARLVVGIDQVDAVPRLTPNQKQLMHITCHALLSERSSQERLHARVGDLVYLELELENADLHSEQSGASTKQRRVVPIFAYVKYCIRDALTESTIVNKEILKHSSRPSTKLTLVLLAKYRPYDVKMSHAMRLMVVSYIKPDLRLFQAMAHLISSPLCNHILMPAEQDFSLSDITNQQFVPFIKQDNLNEVQKQAVLQTAGACLRAEPKICMIQGPPGTGKSLVIVNLIIQILYAQRQNWKQGSRRKVPKILVCAPSNAAIDEVVVRLLRIRQSIQKKDRFRMVRTGRMETMKPSVKDISVVELAKRDARSNVQYLECVESVDLEVRNLEARKNSLSMALETAKQKGKENSVIEIEFKLGEVELKLSQLRRSKMQHSVMQPQDLLRMEREAQSRIILGADIVATTLSSCFNNQMETVLNMQKQKDMSGHHFTCCIIDEATQSQELETLIPLMLGVNTLVLVGDAKQLPATVLSKMAKERGLGDSLFARIQKCFDDTVRSPVLFLETQYRMHPEICLWPSRYFYNGRLHSAPNMAEQRSCPLVPYCILSLDYEQHSSGELSNSGEAALVSQLILGLLEVLGNQYSIAVITPYNKQRTVITSLLHASPGASQNVDVSTIDSFQGQEKDVIVMSCVRTGGVGFLSDTQRLNVALTRAKCSLLLCGNFTSLQNDNMWRALLENANRRNVLKRVPKSVAENKNELLKLVLRSS